MLQRQLERYYPQQPPPESIFRFLRAIGDAYQDFDDERLLLEQSLENVSTELYQRNAELKSKLRQLQVTHQQFISSAGILDGILDATGEAIFAFDRLGRLLRMNTEAEAVVGIDNAEPLSTEVKYILDNLLSSSPDFRRDQQRLIEDPNSKFSGLVELDDNSIYEYHSSPQYADGETIGRVWSFRNVTLQKQNEALIKHQAFHDALTNLPNRVLLLDRIEHAATFCDRVRDKLAVLFIDLDHFKKVNDTQGHHFGDKLLIEVAQRIKRCLRSHDTLARFGGDEFVVLLEKIDSHSMASSLCRRLIDYLKKPFHIETKIFHISCSVGVSVYPQDDTDSRELIRKADLAMYHAKERGRGTFEFFDPSLERFAQFQLELENRLRTAIKEKELSLYYQPKVCLKTGEIHSVEALLRWFPKDGPPISPASFIPVAERAGLLAEIDGWVLRKASQQIKSWRETIAPNLSVSVNLSAQQFNDENFVLEIENVLYDTDIPGSCLELEITESMLMENFDTARHYLSLLRQIGLKVSIDDFGTGYSSLQYLQRLPIDIIKIDRSFIRQMEENPQEKSIVDAIISLSHSLDLTVVAEGVEIASSYDYLKQRQCDYVQGFYCHKPMSVQALTELLKPELIRGVS